MKASFYSIMAKRVKNILGIKDFSLFRKEMHKKIGKIIYHQNFNTLNQFMLTFKMTDVFLYERSYVFNGNERRKYYMYSFLNEGVL